jgi:hypothetical protein
MRKQAIRGEPTPLSGHEATERTETEHGEETEQADREGAEKEGGRKKVETERLERERLEREKLESERVERELADREWEEQERTQREWDENEPAPIESNEEDEVMPPQTIVIDSDSSDVPSCSGTGATSRVFVSGGTIGVLPKQPPKKGLKRKPKDPLVPPVKKKSSSVKRAKHVTSSESENGFEDKVAAPKNKKEAKTAKTASNNNLGDDNRTWTTKEIECLLCIMEEMLEEFNSISKIKKKLWENVTTCLYWIIFVTNQFYYLLGGTAYEK